MAREIVCGFMIEVGVGVGVGLSGRGKTKVLSGVEDGVMGFFDRPGGGKWEEEKRKLHDVDDMGV